MGFLLKKTLLIFCEAFGGGVLTVIRDQVRAIRSDDNNTHIVIVYCYRPETPLDVHLLFPGCEMIAMSRSRDDGLISLYNEFKSVIAFREFDAVHLHSSYAGFIGRFLLFFKGCRIFYTPHCYSFLDSSKNFVKRFIYLIAEIFLARIGSTISCGDTEHFISKKIGANSILIRNGVGFSCIDEGVLDGDKIYDAVSAGRICSQKGFSDFSKLADLNQSNLKFLWIGGGDLEFKEYVTGWVDRAAVISFLGSSKLYISTAKWEGLPVAPIEAQYLGLPIVALKAPGVNDVVLDGVTGYLCNSVEEMNMKILFLLSNHDVYAAMSNSARHFVNTRFSLQNYRLLTSFYFS
jgi:glycosyltransferase involved in cell wall biosynthesis